MARPTYKVDVRAPLAEVRPFRPDWCQGENVSEGVNGGEQCAARVSVRSISLDYPLRLNRRSKCALVITGIRLHRIEGSTAGI
jgi:hypothetical protein